MEPISNLISQLAQKKKIVITMHQKPDGDAMGSSTALYMYLANMGHEVQVISPTNWADFLKWIPTADKAWDYEKNIDISNEYIATADWIFCLDFNVLSRTRNMQEVLAQAPGKRILIDHHQQPQTEVFSFGISDTGKSSTCEMVYDFIVAAGGAKDITKEIATSLYAGTMTDTGSFRFPSTTASVHEMVAHLKRQGLDHSYVHEALFDNFSENRLRFIGNALLNRMEVFYEYNTAIITIPAQDLLKYDIKTGDTEGLVNYPLSIEGIKLAAILIDRGEERKLSFRSKGTFDVNVFARTYFNGGGHKNASGGGSALPLDDVKAAFIAAMKENIEELSTYKF